MTARERKYTANRHKSVRFLEMFHDGTDMIATIRRGRLYKETGQVYVNGGLFAGTHLRLLPDIQNIKVKLAPPSVLSQTPYFAKAAIEDCTAAWEIVKS